MSAGVTRGGEAKGEAKGEARVATGALSAPVPGPVRGAAMLAAVEAIALGVVCSVYLRAILTGHPGDRGSALLGAGMGLALAVLLGLLARGLARRRRPALTPIVLTQIIMLPVSWGLYQGGQWAVAVVMAALSLGVLGLLFGSAEARGTFS
jgi:hypothetical protein